MKLHASLLFVSRVTLPSGERGNARYSLDCVHALRDAGLNVHVLVTEGAVRTPVVWDTAPSPEEIALVRETLDALRPDILLVNYSYLSELLDVAPDGCLRGILTHDARHLRHADFVRLGLRAETSVWSEDDERRALARADFVVAIQEDEAAEFVRLAPRARVLTTPCSFAPRELPAPPQPDVGIFVGSGADHNLHGLCWFLNQVWPLVLAARPTAMFLVCGTIGHRLGPVGAGVDILGRVDDLEPHYARAAVAIVPLLAGSGLKLKLVEALAHGRPGVVTPTGLAGLAAEDGVLAAKRPEAFADALLRLFADPALAAAMGRAGREMVRRRFNRTACYGPLLDYLAARTGNGH